MNQTLLSYVPRHVVTGLQQYDDIVGVEQRMHVVAMFADVSGFTVISEALGETGKAGTEELVGILNSYFEPMIALIRRYGGTIGKFGGDAMTVLFPYEVGVAMPAVRRAIQCAAAMQAKMADYVDIPTSVGEYSLTMKAGLSMGPIFTMTTGEYGKRLEYIIAGDALDLCADAEHHATKGQIVVQDTLLSYTGGVEIVKRMDGFTQIIGLQTPAAPLDATGDLALSAEKLAIVRDFIPRAIADRILQGRTNFIAEHRLVTVLFATFEGFDYDNDPDVGRKLQTYLADVIAIIDRYDGTLNKVDMGDKGSKFMVLFGAPVGHEDDEIRVARCALELSQLPVPSRIGVNSGFVFCGQVGSNIRQEYTVIGDAVNLASRLMQYSKIGQIIISDYTRRVTGDIFDWSEPQTIQVKGKSEPVTVYQLLDLHRRSIYLHRPQYRYPLVGRKDEQAQIAARIAGLARGEGAILGISGEAGAGKSRLAVKAMEIAEDAHFAITGGECLSYGTNISYQVWQGVWRGFFDLRPDQLPAGQIARLTDQLNTINPQLVQRAPLLAPVLGLPIQDNEFTRELDGQLRFDLTFSLLLECLRHRLKQEPLMIVLEDCQWLDPVSQQLLAFVGRNIVDLPVLLLLIYREEGAMIEDTPARSVTTYDHFYPLPLAAFKTADAEALISVKLAMLTEAVTIPTSVTAQIIERSQGNPFYIEEILNYIHERELDLSDVDMLDLPDSLHSLIISRIDTLGEDEKVTVKVASVIGRFFKADWIWNAYPEGGGDAVIQRQLSKLNRLDITPIYNVDNYEYMFKHITTQEVAYGSLAYATREMLHERFGHYVERAYGDEIEQYIDTLAYHYGHSTNDAKKREYLLRAGDHAKAIYANEAAIDYYQRVLPIVPAADRAEVLVALGEVLQLIGRWDDAENLYREAVELAQQQADRHALAKAQNALGLLLSKTDKPEVAVEWLQKGLVGFRNVRDQAGVEQVMQNIGTLLMTQYRYDEAERYFDQLRQSENPRSVVEANLFLSWVHMRQGDFEVAEQMTLRAIHTAQENNYKHGEYATNADLAGFYFMRGDFRKSIGHCNAALEAAQSMGFLEGIRLVIGNTGEIYRQLGDFTRALRCYHHALALALELGNVRGMFFSLVNLSSLYFTQGNDTGCIEMSRMAADLDASVNTPYVLCSALYRQAAAHHALDERVQAAQVNARAAQMAQQAENQQTIFATTVLQKQLDGDIDGLLALIGTETEPEHEARLYDAVYQINPARTDARDRAATLYRELYAKSPNVIYRRAYHRLTGDALPEPPPLPHLTDALGDDVEPLDVLLDRVRSTMKTV